MFGNQVTPAMAINEASFTIRVRDQTRLDFESLKEVRMIIMIISILMVMVISMVMVMVSAAYVKKMSGVRNDEDEETGNRMSSFNNAVSASS